MSCLTTAATRRSRIGPAAVRTASAAASSHEVLLVPMTSVTLYTLMTPSLDALPARAPRRSGGPPSSGAGSGRQVRRPPPDLSLALSLSYVQDCCPADPRPPSRSRRRPGRALARAADRSQEP